MLKTTLSDVLLGCENLCTHSKVCSSNEKLNETTKGNNLKCGEHSLNFGNPDFVKYAESYGAYGHRVNHQDDLYPTIEKCVNSKGVHLIDIPVDYTKNDQILNVEIKEKSREIV